MERYEAILEQLRKAQGRGLETITNRLDFVVQSLEELIQEAKSSVQGALPQSADECLPVDEVVAALDGFRDEAEAERRRAAELEDQISELEASLASAGEGLPVSVLRTLDGARSQSELLRELLPVLSEHAARAVVLVLREGSVSAWSGIGFTDGELLRGWQAGAHDSPALVTMQDASAPVAFAIGDDPVFSRWLADAEQPSEAMLVPVVLRGRMMGAIYVDRLDDQPWCPAAAQTLVALVCLLIDTLAVRSAPAAMLAEPVKVEAAVAEPEGAAAGPMDQEPEADTFDEAQAPPEVGFPALDPSATVRVDFVEAAVDAGMVTVDAEDGAGEDETEAEEPSAVGLEPEETAGLASELGAGDEKELEPVEAWFEPEAAEAEFEPETAASEFEPAQAVPPDELEPGAVPEAEVEVEVEAGPAEVAPAEVEMPSAPSEEKPTKAPTGFLGEPPPVKPVQPPPAEPEVEVSEDEAKREEAHRFARLLVSEIKLYNEEQVERGREARDVYRRLQEDIDRSREMFEKRISPEVRAKRDFFHDELVRILADGDPDLLGM